LHNNSRLILLEAFYHCYLLYDLVVFLKKDAEFLFLYPAEFELRRIGTDLQKAQRQCKGNGEDKTQAIKKRSAEKIIYYTHYPARPRGATKINVPYIMPHYVQKFFLQNKDKIGGAYVDGDARGMIWSMDSLILYIKLKVLIA